MYGVRPWGANVGHSFARRRVNRSLELLSAMHLTILFLAMTSAQQDVV